MECGQCFPSQPFVVLTVDQFVGHGGGPLERQKQDKLSELLSGRGGSIDAIVNITAE